MPKQVLLLGAGGHGKVIAEIVVSCGNVVKGFLDDSQPVGSTVLGFPVLGGIGDIRRWVNSSECIIAIGDNKVRQRIDMQYPDIRWYTAIHPTAHIAMDTVIGEGTAVMAQAVVHPSAHVGRHCILNTGTIVEHDNTIGDYTHLSPHAVLGGNVTVGSCVHIAIGAAVRDGLSVADNTIVGVGAAVVKSIIEPGVYIGVPARRYK